MFFKMKQLLLWRPIVFDSGLALVSKYSQSGSINQSKIKEVFGAVSYSIQWQQATTPQSVGESTWQKVARGRHWPVPGALPPSRLIIPSTWSTNEILGSEKYQNVKSILENISHHISVCICDGKESCQKFLNPDLMPGQVPLLVKCSRKYMQNFFLLKGMKTNRGKPKQSHNHPGGDN